MDLIFEKIPMKSKKLNKDVELDCYTESSGDIIVSTNALKKLFEEIKSEFGITDSIKTESKFNEQGNILYGCVEWTLRDKFGYTSTFIGEATMKNLDNPIAKKYPMTTAFNRAQSAGIIAYLQLPGKVYSDSQRNTVEKKTVADENTDGNTSPNATIGKKSTIAGIITSVPEMPNDAANTDNETNGNVNAENTTIDDITNKTENTKSNITETVSDTKSASAGVNDDMSDISSIVSDAEKSTGVITATNIPNVNDVQNDGFVDIPEGELPFNDDDEALPFNDSEMPTNESNESEKNENVVAESTEQTNNSENAFSITPETLVGIGVFANTTVREFIENYKKKQDMYVKFMQMMKGHKIQIAGDDKKRIMEYLINNVD